MVEANSLEQQSGFDRITAFIGLGSNLDDPVAQVKQARGLIGQSDNIWELAFSSLYKSSPMGPVEQSDYVNAVMAVETTLTAFELLRVMQEIENRQGRARTGNKWGPRTLDLDLLLYGQEVIKTAELTVPHYGFSERAFVLYPLAEIFPDLHIPTRGSLKELLQCCPQNGLQLIS